MHPPLIFRCKIVLFVVLDPVGHMSFQIPETMKPGQAAVVETQVENLSILVFVEVFQCFTVATNPHHVML
jgi:uncharacterized membrane protein (DUF373 family)